MRIITAGLVLLLITCPCNAIAFELSGPVWVSGNTTFHVNIPGLAPSGDSWNSAFKRAMLAWSAETTFSFTAVDEYKDPCAGQNVNDLGDRINGVDFAATRCGFSFGENVLAVTLESFVCTDSACSGSREYVETDIIFNESANWDIYSGPKQSGIEEFERVALHELGHALGLDHEFTADAIMAPFISDLTTLQLDDINGVNFLYGSAITLPSIYGIPILVPDNGLFTESVEFKQFTGELQESDASFEDKAIDIYQFSLANETQLDIAANSEAFDPSLILARIDSTQQLLPGQLFADSDSGDGNNARLKMTVAAGTYWAGVSSDSSGAAGPYSLDISTVTTGSNNLLASFDSIYGIAVEINPNPVIFQELAAGDDRLENKYIDVYQIEVASPIELKIDLRSEQFDTHLTLVHVLTDQQLGSLQIENDDGGIGTNSRIQAELDPGTYWIAATSFADDATGDYDINITVVVP